MDKKAYLQAVVDQIRYDGVKETVVEELENHLEDQIEAYEAEGIALGEAEKKAIEQMGDPIEVGVELDRIHRPGMEWRLLLLIGVLSMFGLLVQAAIMKTTSMDTVADTAINLKNQFFFIVVGICVMMLFCFCDYTRIGKYAKAGGAGLILLLLCSLLQGITINGQRGYLSLGQNITISIGQTAYLFVPFFGGILYSYKDEGKKGLLKSFLWLIIPVFLEYRLPNLTISSTLMLIMMLQIIFAIKKGWFQASKKVIGGIVSFIIGVPVLFTIYIFLFGAAYQKARLLAVVSKGGEQNYQLQTGRALLNQSRLLGQGSGQIEGMLPDVYKDYVLTYIFYYYGILAALLLLAGLGFLLFRLFKISFQQKNQLGMIIGLGCSLVYAVEICVHVLVNLTILPSMGTFLPLFSFGGVGTFVSFALLGIMLSIYRYKNVVPCKVKFAPFL